MSDENEKIGECPAKNWEISVISELHGKLDCYRFEIKEKDATISRLDQEVERLKKELAEWEASKNHMIDIIHDSTAPFLARAEQAEADLAAARKVIEGMEELLKEIVGEVKSQGEEKKKRRKIVKKVLIVSAVVLLLGCAAIPLTPEERYSRMFSGHVGCPASEVKIVNIDTEITSTTVLLECKGKRFYCTEKRSYIGAGGTSCAEAR